MCNCFISGIFVLEWENPTHPIIQQFTFNDSLGKQCDKNRDMPPRAISNSKLFESNTGGISLKNRYGSSTIPLANWPEIWRGNRGQSLRLNTFLLTSLSSAHHQACAGFVNIGQPSNGPLTASKDDIILSVVQIESKIYAPNALQNTKHLL